MTKKHRPFELLPLNVLKEKATAEGIRSTTKKKIIDKLIKPSNERGQQPSSRPMKRAVPPTIAPLVNLLKQSYLRPQKDGNRAAAAIGHKNEEPFLHSFNAECEKSHTDNGDLNPYDFDLPIKAIYRVGLMRKKGSSFAKACLDGAAFLEDDDGEIQMVPVEVKSRVSSTTMTEAHDRIEEEVGAELYDERKKYQLRLSSSNQLLKTLLHDKSNPKQEKSEAFQLLHSAYVAGSKHGIMLIGSRDKLMYGMFVDYDEDLLNAYDTVMQYMYDMYFRLFYDSTSDELAENASLIEAIDLVDWLDMHSFLTNYNVWRALNVEVNASNIWFPLPPCARLIPFQNSLRNVFKGNLSRRCFCLLLLFSVLTRCLSIQ